MTDSKMTYRFLDNSGLLVSKLALGSSMFYDTIQDDEDGTSEWLAADIQEACDIADRLGLIRPIVEQPQYNIFERNKVENEFVDLYKKYSWVSPLWPHYCSVRHADRFHVVMADKLKPLAAELGCMHSRPIRHGVVRLNRRRVDGTRHRSRPSQLEENLKSLDFVDKMTPEVKAKIDAIVPKVPAIDQFSFARKQFL